MSIESFLMFWDIPLRTTTLLAHLLLLEGKMKIGYIRVSCDEQNAIRQEVLMQELGVDEIYIDKASGKNTDKLQPLKCKDTY